VILHITNPGAWADARACGVYEAESLATEGFIHCSTPDQVLWVANQRFRGRPDLVLLHIDETRLAAPVHYENLEGGDRLFPHVYGPLNVDAVAGAIALEPRPDGCFDENPGDEWALQQIACGIAAAIARRDDSAMRGVLAPGFVYRAEDGGTSSDAAFLEGIRSIPGEILFVRLDSLAIDLAGAAALLTGVQHARVKMAEHVIDDRRGFADFFVKVDAVWKLRAAVDHPMPAL
jgi:uncharacterized protein (DUF952 family)